MSDLLAAVPIATVDGASDGATVYRQLAPYSAPATPVTLARVPAGRERPATRSQNLVGAEDPRTASADRALATSVAAAWQNRDGRRQARDLLAGIGTSVNGFLKQIQVQPRTTITDHVEQGRDPDRVQEHE